MPPSLDELEQQRAAILSRILQLGDFRSGSITATSARIAIKARARATGSWTWEAPGFRPACGA